MAKGDHIFTSLYIEGNLITHHGIDCGDGTVIHYSKRIVERVPQSKFCNGKTITIKQYGECEPPDIVVKNAESRLGEAKYNALTNNCEHFAYRCKTGKHHSEQMKNVVTGAGMAGVQGGTATGAVLAAKAVEQSIYSSLNPLAKGLIKIGLQEAPKVAGRAAIGIAGAGGLVSGVATDMVLGEMFKDNEHEPQEERDAREAARNAAKVGSTIGGIGGTVAVGVVGGGATAIGVAVAAPVVLGVAAAFGIYHLWKS